MVEYKKFYGKCDKYNKDVSIEIEFLVSRGMEGKDYAISKIRHCPLDPKHECKRNECPIWNSVNL